MAVSFFADELSTFFYQRWGVQLLAFCVRKGELQRKLIMPWGGCIVAVVVFFNFCSFLTVLGIYDRTAQTAGGTASRAQSATAATPARRRRTCRRRSERTGRWVGHLQHLIVQLPLLFCAVLTIKCCKRCRRTSVYICGEESPAYGAGRSCCRRDLF